MGTGGSGWCFEDDIMSCLCGARSRAHKKECPLNSRNRYVRWTLFPKASSVDSDKVDSCVKSKLPKTSKRICVDHLCWRLSLVYCFQHWMW